MATLSISNRPLNLPYEKKKSPLRRNPTVELYFGIGMLGIFIIFLAFLYLSEFNRISSQGVIINTLEQERSQLIIKNEVWNMRIAKLKSLDVIERQDVVKKMQTISPAEIRFITIKEGKSSASDSQ